MLPKRVYSTSKSSSNSRYHDKPHGKEGSSSSSKSSSSRHKSTYEVHVAEADTTTLILSQTKPVLPCYTSVLTRSADDGVCMDDLDPLQQDLEKLLSNCALRNRSLRSEIECIDRSEERRGKKRRLSYDKQSDLKRKRPEEKSSSSSSSSNKYKAIKNGQKVNKNKHYSVPLNNLNEELPIKREKPKITLPKNDTQNKFWLSIDPYCRDVSRDDIAFLHNLIAESSVETELKIPEIGPHYALDWPSEMLNQEQSVGNIGRPAKAKPSVHNNLDMKKNPLYAMVDTFGSPMTERLLAGLIDENVMTKFPAGEKLKDLTIRMSGPRPGLCVEKRLRKELMEQGILDVDDMPKMNDAIREEIEKCDAELQQVKSHNIRELSKLLAKVEKEPLRQEVKDAQDKNDNQVIDLYNKILMSKQKPATSEDDDDENKLKILPHDFELEAGAVMKTHIMLHDKSMELTDLTMLY